MTATMTKTKSTLSYLYHQLNNQDHKAQTKMLDLVEKYESKQKRIGFAGHFSAGKSTLINTLLKKQLLPSSPIPTSANIVHLKEGPPYTTAYFRSGAPEKFEGNLDFETVKSLCKNGDEITRVDISRRKTGLPEHVTLLDTPGVDSTNDADRLITESSLHTIDYLYYVMDYNHVQSEVNLKFLWEMQQRGIPFSVVINQIDKHNEQELSFKSFQDSVMSSLEQWGISPESLYYISLRDFSMEMNQWATLNSDFHSLFEQSEAEREEKVLEQASQVLNESLEEKMTDIYTELQNLKEDYAEWSSQVSEEAQKSFRPFEEEREEAEEKFKKQIRSFISNAYLMPGRLRDDAEAFLHSVQPKFKVGLIFSRRKTEEAQEERERIFYEELQSVIEKNLIWPLRDRMYKLSEEFDIEGTDIIQQEPFVYEKKRLHELVESGAQVTGAYVLRYTDQVANDIQQQMKSHIQMWWHSFVESLKRKTEARKQENYEAYQMVQQMEENERKQEELNEHRQTLISTYENWFRSPLPTEEMEAEVDKAIREREEIVQTAVLEPTKKETATTENRVDLPSSDVKSHSTKEEVLQTMNQFIEEVGHVEGLEELFQQLKEKRERLEHRHFTVALFGAFSAGKSSFANALLGESLLPSSPNPTTATINKISPPDAEHSHKSVRVSLKTEEQMLEDLSEPLDTLNIEHDHLKGVYDQLQSVSNNEWNRLNQKNRAFIQAFLEGFEEMEGRIGSAFLIEWDHFESYVSNERYSCFVESMELYYDSEWTRKGVTLVDTPGADSVNSRHTDVSFEYIKDADAILFVTYYNHPFSKADESFLTQLGRVKDSFAMDKMFFIINASDLAESEEELTFVESYVNEQLQRFHIRQPRLFSLSSKVALEEKHSNRAGNSEMRSFEDRFETFLEEELQQVLIESMWEDLHTISDTLHSFIEYAKMDEVERQDQLQQLEDQKERAVTLLRNVSSQSDLDQIKNKAEKQVYYIHERMMLNGHDLFKQHVNPATINGQEDSPKEQLKQSLLHFSEEVNEERKQELRAVSLRIERFIQNRLEDEKRRLTKELRTIHDSLSLQVPDWEPVAVPSFEEAHFFSEKEAQSLTRQFRNTRSFFEKNEKEQVKEDLLGELSPRLKERLNEDEGLIRSYYQKYWNERYEEAAEKWMNQTITTFERFHYRLSHPVSITELEGNWKAVNQLLQRSNQQ